jgi:drug/metabolite transporter superfamily protein YnfA
MIKSLLYFVAAGLCEIGGMFVVLSILWGWRVDKVTPDKFDIIGGAGSTLLSSLRISAFLCASSVTAFLRKYLPQRRRGTQRFAEKISN